MSKFHINKHGVPAPCRAQKGNCPLGGESGNDNHFNTQEEAQTHANKINEAEHSFLPGIESNEQYSYNEEDLSNMKGKQIAVEYDGKSFAGEVIGTHFAGDESDNNGIIIQDSDGNVKHIKSHRLNNVKLEGDEEKTGGPQGSKVEQIKQPLSDKEIAETGKRLTSLIGSRKGSVQAPELSKDDTRSIGDLDTLVETRGEFITSQEHNPVKNVQSMFDHVAGKSGKLYRYNDTDSPYLETHEYDFNSSIRNHRDYLERNDYLDSEDSIEQFTEDYNTTPREAFEKETQKHRKLHDYAQNLAIEYGKDFEKKVVLSGKYSHEEQDKIQGEYRKALADKVGAHIQNYGEEGFGEDD